MTINGFDQGHDATKSAAGWLRHRILLAARSAIGPIPFLGPAARHLLRKLRLVKRKTTRVWELKTILVRRPAHVASLVVAWRHYGATGLRDQARRLLGIEVKEHSATEWLNRVRPNAALLSRFARKKCPDRAPRFTILTPVYNVRQDWLRAAVDSVLAQTYPNWELILVNDGSTQTHIKSTLDEFAARDSRVKVLHLTINGGVGRATNLGLEHAQGDYVAFMDHDDYLEPHALHRFAQATLADGADLIYSDEAVTSENIDEILLIPLRLAFSYDYYLCHPYYVHLISVKTSLLREVGGIDETMTVSQDVDLGLRLIERCRAITHVPEVLYRWRMHGTSLSHQQFNRVQEATRGALERHLSRMRVVATVEDRTHHNFRDIRFRPRGAPRVAILVSGHEQLRSRELGSPAIAATVSRNLAKVMLVECGADGDALFQPQGRTRGRGAISPPRGKAALLNETVGRLDSSFTHYLFFDAKLEPLTEGWLEHMLGFVTRGDVGVVGPLLIDGFCRIRHAGLLVGVSGSVLHAHGGAGLKYGEHNRNPGRNGELLCTRDVAAVSGRCMLVDAKLFRELDGFDSRFLTGLYDVDFCLRTRAADKKVLFDAHALFLDHDDTGSQAEPSKHDLRLLRSAHRTTLERCDVFFHPLLAIDSPLFVNSPLARAREQIQFRTTEVVVPGLGGRWGTPRVDHAHSSVTSRSFGISKRSGITSKDT